jgi:hypothetical protein
VAVAPRGSLFSGAGAFTEISGGKAAKDQNESWVEVVGTLRGV